MPFKEKFKKAWSEDSIRLFATPSQSAKKMYYYIQEIGYFHTQEHYFTEREGLNSYLIIYGLSGIGYLNYRGKRYKVTPGQLLFINCMEKHDYETDNNELWEILWVHFNGSSSKGYFEQFMEHQGPLVTLPKDTKTPYYIEKMILLHKEKHLQREMLSSNYLVNILTEILVETNSHYDNKDLPHIISQVQDYIDHHFTEKITLDVLEKEFSVSKYHLARLYKRHTGFSIIDYLISLRITHAKQLLRFSDLTIQSISYTVGIENISHFIHLFKTREDITPLQFRKNWQ